MVSKARGVALLYALITLAVMFMAAAALIRASQSSGAISGALAFKRDAVNQSDRAVTAAITSLSAIDKGASNTAANYSAIALKAVDEDANGIPLALTNNTKFAAIGVASNDIVDAANGLTIRYVVDRRCSVLGSPADSACSIGATNAEPWQNSNITQAGGTGTQYIYRISVRIIGPRNTLVFAQTMVAI
jgi:hypothetical protein